MGNCSLQFAVQYILLKRIRISSLDFYLREKQVKDQEGRMKFKEMNSLSSQMTELFSAYTNTSVS